MKINLESSEGQLLCFLLTYWNWKNDKTSPLPELVPFFEDSDKLIQFVKIFGGYTIKIPTFKDLIDEVFEGAAGQFHLSEGCSFEYIQEILEINNGGGHYDTMKKRILEFEAFIKAEGLNG